MTYSSPNTIRTVAAREIQVAAKNRGILVSMALTLIVIIAGITAAAYFTDRAADEEGPTVATTEAAVFEGTDFEVHDVDDRPAAEAAVLDGDAEAALVHGENGWELLADGNPNASLTETINAAVAGYETNRVLTDFGIDPAEFAAATAAGEVAQVDLSAEDEAPADFLTTLVALAGIFVLLFAIMLFAANIGSRVTEEKSSRVVELILASVRPMDFLAGKILGNALFGLACTLVITLVAVVGLMVSGLLDGFAFDWVILPLLVVAFILGIVFFGSLYAAAGAMVQRTEDLQSTQGPIMILLLATMYVPMFGWSNTDATWMQVMGWLPPISIMTAPLQYASGNMSLLEVGLSFALMTAVTVATIWLVARIYRAAILNNGQKMTWVKALRARPA